MSDIHQHPLIDTQAGIELAGGSEDMHKELLAMLKAMLAEHEQEVRAAFEAKDLNELAKAAHKLHGACCYTGTPRLKAASKQLELCAKAGDDTQAAFDTFIKTLHDTDAEL